MWLLTATLGFGGVAILVIGRLGVQGRLRRNRWAGIRSSWATATDETWLVAHKAAGGTFMLSGAVVVMLAAVLPVVGDDSEAWANTVALLCCGVMLVGSLIAAGRARRAVRAIDSDSAA